MKKLIYLSFVLLVYCSPNQKDAAATYRTHEELVDFFFRWREFQKPPIVNGLPDYSKAAMQRQHNELKNWLQQLNAFDTTGWPVSQQVDWYLIYAEMNGLDFDHRVLRPWERDPAFYVWFFSYPSDVPAREGPHVYGAIELPAFKQPLSQEDAEHIRQQLLKAEELFQQARVNLTGDARDLWITGIRSVVEGASDLDGFAQSVQMNYPGLAEAALQAAKATRNFAEWLKEQAPSRQGPSGVGKENYTWYLRHVHLLPYSWEDEERLLERELYRAHSTLRLLEHQNRKLPQLEKVKTGDAHRKLLTDGVQEYIKFLDEQEVITVHSWMKDALMEQIGKFIPGDELLNFFYEIEYRDPMPMRAHHFHWIDKAREKIHPQASAIRRTPLLYNIFDSRAEGLATAMEELVMHAGLLENRPRAKELMYIMLIQRAARGLGGLYQHSQEMTFDEATRFASKWVPRGLLPAEGSTIQHEEQFYLEQPAYGSSYVIGKLMIDQLIAEYARQRNDRFVLREFMDDFTSRGIIPMSLLYWEMTGDKSLLEKATSEAGTTF
ncbi:MAG: DUF885 domain-containing protein [Cyclobacteriaceae bacterium]|nr:DUF885 domain-containing protein [Cyclobacteriaceae bacterium]MCX7636895.1 DUF885 domain-containing protein [Cyclobacteriaceae bacterium]MDW8330219.1 DUF885 family protein [Cyclobacteriaceae bacterium]